MQAPLNLRQLCQITLQKTRRSRLHHIYPSQRLAIYKAFGTSARPANFAEWKQEGASQQLPLTHADHARCWLAVITAYSVLPIYEQGCTDDSERGRARGYIETVKGLLEGKIPIETARNSWMEDNYEIVGDKYATNSAAGWALQAAHNAIEELYFNPLRGDFALHFNFWDSDVSDLKHLYASTDVASAAVRAYSCIEPNKDNYNLSKFDLEKRLEFWQWWLTEAIPEAWAVVV